MEIQEHPCIVTLCKGAGYYRLKREVEFKANKTLPLHWEREREEKCDSLTTKKFKLLSPCSFPSHPQYIFERQLWPHFSHSSSPRDAQHQRGLSHCPRSSSYKLRMWARIGGQSAENILASGRNPPETSWSQKSRNRSWRPKLLVRINSCNWFFLGFERSKEGNTLGGKGNKVRGIKARHENSLGLSFRETD